VCSSDLGSSSPVVGNLIGVLELDMGWGSVGSLGEFGFSNLVAPGSGVHVFNSLACFLPFFNVFRKLISFTTGVLDVLFKIFFDIEFEFKSLVNVIINLSSDFLS
jgi:hypothetical protein